MIKIINEEFDMLLKKIYLEFSRLSEYLQSISLLFARLVVAYGFYEPAINKWKDIDSVAAWFGSMGIPMPTLNAYMAASTELIGVVLLVLGLFTRVISIPLIIIMIVAITTVHLGNGFSAADNGFEIPLYYMIFLLIFLSQGAGKFSLDRKIFGEKN
jgi:putative oxidoreductase